MRKQELGANTCIQSKLNTCSYLLIVTTNVEKKSERTKNNVLCDLGLKNTKVTSIALGRSLNPRLD